MIIRYLLLTIVATVSLRCSTSLHRDQAAIPSEGYTRDVRQSAYATYDSLGYLSSIDVAGMLASCQAIYMNCNIHWYLDDDCSGTYRQVDDPQIDRQEAWRRSYDMISGLNQMYVNLGVNKYYQASNAPEYSEPSCVPIRFVLRDVHIHCATEPRETNVSFKDFFDYVVDGDSVMNIFISVVRGTASGFAGGRGHMLVVEQENVPLLCHEFGHNFGLRHPYAVERSNTHTTDKCMDVRLLEGIAWDGDGDGVLDDDKPKGNCWDHKPGGDANNNGVGDYCEGRYADNPHPCCDWAQQDNNVMMSSAWSKNATYSAITPCQTERMLHVIHDKKLKYAAHVGDCPPPSAIIGVAPVDPSDLDAVRIVHMEASFNAVSHQYYVYNDGGKMTYDSSPLTGRPRAILLDDRSRRIMGLDTIGGATVKLKVNGECGQVDVATYRFTKT